MNVTSAKRREERVKLVATARSNTGIAAFIAGGVGPVFLGRLELPLFFGGLAVATAFLLAGQTVLHYVAADDPREVRDAN